LLVLRDVEQRLGIAERLAACIRDRRTLERIVHALEETIGFRMLKIAAGYADGNYADSLRGVPRFKFATDRLQRCCSSGTPRLIASKSTG
jgi:hypothetical protein